MKKIAIGDLFGRWEVIDRDLKKSADGHIRWICRCTCGSGIEKSIVSSTLRKGTS